MTKQEREGLKRLIEFASREAAAEGLDFTAYLLGLATTSLEPGGQFAVESLKEGAFGPAPSKLQ